MAKDGTTRGGARVGSGAKKKAISEKIASGNPGGRKLGVLDIPETVGAAELEGVDITSAIADSCEPIPDFAITFQRYEDKATFTVEVFPGKRRPYYIKALGVDDGTYFRVAGETRRADEYIIKELQLEGANRSFDRMISIGDSISDEQITALCETLYQLAIKYARNEEERKNQKPVTKGKLLDWGLLTQRDGHIFPTNGIMMLIQNHIPQAKIQCGVFKGKTRSVFLDRKEYDGSLFNQVEEAYSFVLRASLKIRKAIYKQNNM